MDKWDDRFMDVAKLVASWSKDRSTKVGCVIVRGNDIIATGYNGFPRGINDDVEERHERPAKYIWTEHAERNAVYAAARRGEPLNGTKMYLPWYPCMDCARAIVQSGITTLIATEPNWEDPKWGTDFKATKQLLEEANITVEFYNDRRV